MKKSVIVLLLAATSCGSASAGRPCGTAATCAGNCRSGRAAKKVIQDPNEYNAYVAAVNATDPAQKAQMMESYLQTYPNSVMKEDGLEVLLKTYQQLNNKAKIKATAQHLLQIDPNNLTALAMLSYLDRAQAQAGGPMPPLRCRKPDNSVLGGSRPSRPRPNPRATPTSSGTRRRIRSA